MTRTEAAKQLSPPERDGVWRLSADPTTANGHPKKVAFALGLLLGPACVSLTDGRLWAPAVVTGTWHHTMLPLLVGDRLRHREAQPPHTGGRSVRWP